MKKFLLIPVLALALFSCSNKNTCTVKGTIQSPDCLKEGSIVCISYMNEPKTDTVQIVKGNFKYTCEADPTTLRQFAVKEENDPMAKPVAVYQFIPEKGKIILTIDPDNKVSINGGPVNEAFAKYNEDSKLQMEEYMNSFRSGDSNKTESVIDSIYAYNKETYAANKDNFVGLQAFIIFSSSLELEEMEKYMEEAEPFIAKDERFVTLLEGLKKKAETAEGALFKDFTGTAPDGSPISLSDFVGKGSYTVVDFWASWCGPCKREMPNLKDIYDTFGPKGLKMVSVAVWDGDNTISKETIKELGMSWNHIFTGNDNTATDLYGINAIPHIIVFSPDGKILKRDLRGEELKEYVSNLF